MHSIYFDRRAACKACIGLCFRLQNAKHSILQHALAASMSNVGARKTAQQPTCAQDSSANSRKVSRQQRRKSCCPFGSSWQLDFSESADAMVDNWQPAAIATTCVKELSRQPPLNVCKEVAADALYADQADSDGAARQARLLQLLPRFTPELLSFEASECSLGDTGAKLITYRMASWLQLQKLVVYGNNMSHIGAQAPARAVAACPSLVWLGVPQLLLLS